MKKNRFIKWAVPILIIAIIISVASSMLYTVRENEYALVLRFSKVESIVKNPGIHIKIPFIEEIRYYPKTQLFYDILTSEVFTKDSKNMTVDSFVVWKISDPLIFHQQMLGLISNAESRLDNITYNALKNIIGTFEQNDIISSTDEKSRNNLNVAITNQAKINMEPFGIEVIDVKIKRFDLPQDNEQSVFRRMISDRERAAEFERAEGQKEATIIKNEVDKTVNITVSDAEAAAKRIIAEGEAEYMKILANAYNSPEKEDFFIFMRGLDAFKMSFDGENKTMILDKDSPLAQILTGP